MAARIDPKSVFINAPFDDEYEPLFDALVYCIMACGYQPRCALEENDSGDIRLDRLIRLLSECPRSIHDLSEVKLGKTSGLPRFNMPFELGLALGARAFGSKARKSHRIKILVAEPFKMPAYLSDLAGNDPGAHGHKQERILELVRDFLHTYPNGVLLPGPAKLMDWFEEFQTKRPELAARFLHRPAEVGGFKNYKTFVWMVSTHVAGLPAV